MKRTILLTAGLGAAALWAATALHGDPDSRPDGPKPLLLSGSGGLTAYHAAAIHTSTPQGTVEDGYLVVEGGKIVGVVADAGQLPALAPVVELGDAHLMPGLVAVDSTLAGSRGQGDRSMAAHMLASDSFDPWLDHAKVLERGITSYYLSPDRSRLIGGRGAVVKAAGEDRVLLAQGDLRVNLTPSAWNPPDYFRPPMPPTAENPLLPAIDQAPNSRPGALRALRQAWAAEQMAGDPNLQGLRAFKQADAPLRLVVDTADEAASALEFGRSTGHRLILDGLSQADPDQLKSTLARVDVGLVFEVPLFSSMPSLDREWQLPSADHLSGLGDDSLIALRPSRHGRWTWLLEAAAASVGYGLSEVQAIRGVTDIPARFLGVGDRVGALKRGLDADFVVLDGAPLDPAASVRSVYIDGQAVWQRQAAPRLTREATVVRAGTLWTGDGEPIRGGVEVLLEDGRIVAAGHTVPHPAGARIVDAGMDAHITPGLIDSRGFLGTGRASNLPDRTDIGSLADGSYFSELWKPVAQAGITSVVMGPRSFKPNGSGAAIVKTSVKPGGTSSLGDRRVVFFDQRQSDHAVSSGQIANKLKAGKGYFDKWEEYRAERATWEEEQVTKLAEERETREKELRLRLAQGSAPKVEEEVVEEEEEEVEEEEEEAKPVDPLNGLWEGTIEHEMLPEPVAIHVRFHHEGEQVTAIMSSPDDPSGETFEIDGTFIDNVVHIEIPTEMGNVMIDGVIDGSDSMAVKVELAGFGSVEFAMARIEIEEAGAAPIAKRKTKKDEGPQPPGINWNLEPMRALYEGRAVAVVAADRRDEIEQALHAFSEAGLPMQLMYAGEALDMAETLRELEVGVVVAPAVTRRTDNRDFVPAADLQAAGLRVAFQSDASIGARFLPQVLAMATRYGLGAEQALAGLTSDAADMLGLSDRIGRVQPGLDGDLVVFNGPPFDLRTHVVTVFVDGQEVSKP